MTIEFQVDTMTCDHCVAAITSAVKGVDAEGSVNVDLRTKRVTIHSSHPAGDFRAALAEAGYAPLAGP